MEESIAFSLNNNGNWTSHSNEHEGNALDGKRFVESLQDQKVGTAVDFSEDAIGKFMKGFLDTCYESKVKNRLVRLAFFHPEEPFVYLLRVGRQT